MTDRVAGNGLDHTFAAFGGAIAACGVDVFSKLEVAAPKTLVKRGFNDALTFDGISKRQVFIACEAKDLKAGSSGPLPCGEEHVANEGFHATKGYVDNEVANLPLDASL